MIHSWMGVSYSKSKDAVMILRGISNVSRADAMAFMREKHAEPGVELSVVDLEQDISDQLTTWLLECGMGRKEIGEVCIEIARLLLPRLRNM